MEWKLEVIVLPVTDMDRAKRFYTEQLGFNCDVDTQPSPGFRVIQLTPHGSGCSVNMVSNYTEMAPGSLKGLQLTVTDINGKSAAAALLYVSPGQINFLMPAGMATGCRSSW